MGIYARFAKKMADSSQLILSLILMKGDAFVSKLVGMIRILNLAMNKCVEIVEILANLNSLQTESQDIYKHWLHKKLTMIMKNFDYFLLFNVFILELINKKIFAFFRQ